MKIHVQRISARYRPTSFDQYVARSPLMHVQPLYMHPLPAGLTIVTACWLKSEMVNFGRSTADCDESGAPLSPSEAQVRSNLG